MFLTVLNDSMLAVAAFVAAALVVWKVVLPMGRGVRRFLARGGRALDILNGTPAIPDPDRPGEYLRPEMPDMGVRMTTVEAKLDAIAIQKMQADIDQARRASDHAARDARRALKGMTDLRAASEIWHAEDFDVLMAIEALVSLSQGAPEGEPDE